MEYFRKLLVGVSSVVLLWPTLVLSQGPMPGQMLVPIQMTNGMPIPMPMPMPPPTEPCSCEVECCSMPWEMRRTSKIFHMPMVMRLDCCGCVDCPVTLDPSAPLPPQPRPIIQLELPEPPEPPEIEFPEPPEIEYPEVEGKKR